MKKLLFALVFASVAQAAPKPTDPAPGCDIVRQAQAVIIIGKTSWSQTNGVWVQTTTEVGRGNTTVPVIGTNMDGCQLDAFRLDNIVVNGNPETVSVNGWMRQLADKQGNPYKRFSGQYWVSTDSGHVGWAAADILPMSQDTLSLEMHTESAATSATSHPDLLSITIRFNDNAQ